MKQTIYTLAATLLLIAISSCEKNVDEIIVENKTQESEINLSTDPPPTDDKEDDLLEFLIQDNSQVPIQGAVLHIISPLFQNTAFTDSVGIARFHIPMGTYQYTVTIDSIIVNQDILFKDSSYLYIEFSY